MMILILLILFVVSMLGMAILSFSERGAALTRLTRLSSSSADAIARSREAVEEGGDLWSRLARILAPLAGRAAEAGKQTYESVISRLVEAGFRDQSALAVYMGSRIALAVAFASVPLTLPVFWSLSDLQFVGFGLLAGGLGFVIPGMVVDARRRSRQQDVRQGLPDAIDLMVVCVEAGLGMGASLERIAAEFSEISPVLAFEFRLVVLETQAGKSLSEALRGLARRTGVDELNSLVAMLVQTERFGTSLAGTLRVHADALRTKRLQTAEEAAQAAAVKMMLPAFLFIFPAVFIVMVAPGLMKIMAVLG